MGVVGGERDMFSNVGNATPPTNPESLVLMLRVSYGPRAVVGEALGSEMIFGSVSIYITCDARSGSFAPPSNSDRPASTPFLIPSGCGENFRPKGKGCVTAILFAGEGSGPWAAVGRGGARTCGGGRADAIRVAAVSVGRGIPGTGCERFPDRYGCGCARRRDYQRTKSPADPPSRRKKPSSVYRSPA